MKIERKAKNERVLYEQKRKGKKIIVLMASRAMKELGRVTFSPDETHKYT